MHVNYLLLIITFWIMLPLGLVLIYGGKFLIKFIKQRNIRKSKSLENIINRILKD